MSFLLPGLTPELITRLLSQHAEWGEDELTTDFVVSTLFHPTEGGMVEAAPIFQKMKRILQTIKMKDALG